MSRRFFGTGLPGVKPEDLGGLLIVLEGADGSGRSTQIAILKDWLEARGHGVVDVGLKRSTLVSAELDSAQSGNTLGRTTLVLFYATDFADQLENIIIPSLRAGYIVLADRYIYTLMARAIVRGADPEWLRSLYGLAVVPDGVFYLKVSPRMLLERNLEKNARLDYWESGMDMGFGTTVFDSFLDYQRRVQREFRRMQQIYGFEMVSGNRSIRTVSNDLKKRIVRILERGGD
jgi:dTMP kinase